MFGTQVMDGMCAKCHEGLEEDGMGGCQEDLYCIIISYSLIREVIVISKT